MAMVATHSIITPPNSTKAIKKGNHDGGPSYLQLLVHIEFVSRTKVQVDLLCGGSWLPTR